jgi:hypothetical protein
MNPTVTWRNALVEAKSSYQTGGGLSEHEIWMRYGVRLSVKLATDRTYESNVFDSIPKDFLTANYSGKFLEWIVSAYINGGIKLYEDLLYRVLPALTRFVELKNKLSAGTPGNPWTNEKVIENYCGLNSCMRKGRALMGLETVLDRYEQVSVVRAGPTRKPFFKGKTITVYDPRTVEESRYYGNGTKWCTASKNLNAFDRYFEAGPLYIIVPVNANYKGEKYQIHGATTSYMNELDDEIKVTKLIDRFPEIMSAKIIGNVYVGLEVSIECIKKLYIFIPHRQEFEGDYYEITIGSVDKSVVDKILERFPELREDFEYAFKHMEITKILGIRNIGWKVFSDGTKAHFNSSGKLHNDDGPAVIYAPDTIIDGNVHGKLKEEWYQNGKRHRDDGPALIYTPEAIDMMRKFKEVWYQNDVRHRTDGPAAIYQDGSEVWYHNGKSNRETAKWTY